MNEIQPDIRSEPHPRGFGSVWKLVLKKDGEIIDEKLLGQDSKVCKRSLGLSEPKKYYRNRFKEENPEYEEPVTFGDMSEMIAEDVITVMTGGRYDHLEGEFFGGMKMTDDNLRKLADKPSWSMAVE